MADDWLDRVDYHLIGWGIWRNSNGGSVTHGYDSHSAVVSTGGVSKEFDHMVEAEDSRVAWICDQIIDDLKEIYQGTLENKYIMQSVLHHNRVPEEVLLLEAQAAFWKKAKYWLA